MKTQETVLNTCLFEILGGTVSAFNELASYLLLEIRKELS
jgi:hypothetical protein